MKSTRILLALAASALLLPISAQAAKDPAKKEAKKAAREVLAKYDKNNNGTIDGDEIEALRKDFAADPNGALKRFDTNSDGKLDDAEIAAIKAGKKKKAF